MKTVKIATLILLFLSFIFVLTPTVQANTRQFLSSFEIVSPKETAEKEFKTNNNSDGTVTTKVVVYNVKVNLKTDNNGNEYYSKVQWLFDIDAEEPTNVYVIVYFKDENDSIPDYWLTGDGMRSDIFTLVGYESEDEVAHSVLFYMGYNKEKTDRKIEVYYEDGRLACTYGPDDDPDLKGIPAESIEYDIKEDPFAVSTPTPTPTPDDGAKITGYIVNNGGNNIANAKVVARKDGETISTASSDLNGEFVLENLEPGEYGLRITKKGYRSKTITITIEEDGGDEKIVIQMKKR